jgi:hypothetical protein
MSSATSAPLANQTLRRRTRQRWTRGTWIWLSVTSLLVLLFFGAIFVGWAFLAGFVEGEEFSPDTFRKRKFSYVKMPIIGTVIRNRDTYDITGSVEQHLVSGNFIQPINVDNESWDLIGDLKSDIDSVDCDARFLADILEMRTADHQLYWMNWTIDHDKSARIVWPEVARLARDGLYWAIPELMGIANQTDESRTQQFQQEVNQYVSQIYLDQARQAYRNEEFKSALHLAKQSVDVQPTPEAAEVRDELMNKLGIEDQPEQESEKKQEKSEDKNQPQSPDDQGDTTSDARSN